MLKIILKEDVSNLGSLGDIVSVKPGFARNFLLPTNKAIVVNQYNIKQIKHQRKLIDRKRQEAIEANQSIAKKLSSKTFRLSMKSSEGGKLFGSVTIKHIVDLLKEDGIFVKRSQINLSSGIKKLGTVKIPIILHTEVKTYLKLEIYDESKIKETVEEGEDKERSIIKFVN